MSKLKIFSLGISLYFLSPAMAAMGLMLGEPTTPPHLTPSVIARKNAQALVPEILNALRYQRKVQGEGFGILKIDEYDIQDPYAYGRSDKKDLFIHDEILYGRGAYVREFYNEVSLACFFDVLVTPHGDPDTRSWLRSTYPQLVEKMKVARVGLPACIEAFQPAPDNIQLTTKVPKALSIYEELLDYYDQGAQPTAEDLVGNFESRCYTAKLGYMPDSYDPANQPKAFEFSGEKVSFEGGSRFAEQSVVRLSFPKLHLYKMLTYDLGPLDQDASWATGSLRVKKYDRYLILKFVKSTDRPVGAYHPQADLDASAVEFDCYAWKK